MPTLHKDYNSHSFATIIVLSQIMHTGTQEIVQNKTNHCMISYQV